MTGGAFPVSKLWGGRFTKAADKTVEGFTSSLLFDRRLFAQDVRGSVAHVRMLGRQGIIPAADAVAIEQGLLEILAEIKAGQFPFRQEYEDIHLNIEKRLIEKIGPVGGRLHTARSRNDQVITDVHLWVKDEIQAVQALVSDLQGTLVDRATQHLDIIMPGYTHLQRAQPILLSHHLLAYFWMLERDHGRLTDCFRRTDLSPLGAGAMAGTTFPIDREFTAKELGFAGVYPNSMDAVSDRDFILEFLAAAAVCQMHLSRLCEELVNWSSTEFGFVEMDDSYSTGSSIMPQKKNPDVAEIVRGKTGRIYGNLMALLTVLKGIPLTYHSDLQEDKERLFDSVDTLKVCLKVVTGMMATLKFQGDRMAQAVRQDFSNATDMADYLAKKGMPFREAHEVVGKTVLSCIQQGKFLLDCSLEEFKSHSELFEADIFATISPDTCVNLRTSQGGTAPSEVQKQLDAAVVILSAR